MWVSQVCRGWTYGQWIKVIITFYIISKILYWGNSTARIRGQIRQIGQHRQSKLSNLVQTRKTTRPQDQERYEAKSISLPTPMSGKRSMNSLPFYQWHPKMSVDINDYELIDIIGNGISGMVFKAKNRLYKRPIDRNLAEYGPKYVAIKIFLCKENEIKLEAEQEYKNEAEALNRLGWHPSIVRAYVTLKMFRLTNFKLPQKKERLKQETINLVGVGIVFDYCLYGSLDVIFTNRFKEEYNVKRRAVSWMRTLVSGLRHIHSKNLVHRDIKSENILISVDKSGRMTLVISDFGLTTKAIPFKPKKNEREFETEKKINQSPKSHHVNILDANLKEKEKKEKDLIFNNRKDLNLFPTQFSNVDANPEYICSGYYRPPEIFLGAPDHSSFSIDMYSLGIVMWEIFMQERFINFNKLKILSEEEYLCHSLIRLNPQCTLSFPKKGFYISKGILVPFYNRIKHICKRIWFSHYAKVNTRDDFFLDDLDLTLEQLTPASCSTPTASQSVSITSGYGTISDSESESTPTSVLSSGSSTSTFSSSSSESPIFTSPILQHCLSCLNRQSVSPFLYFNLYYDYDRFRKLASRSSPIKGKNLFEFWRGLTDLNPFGRYTAEEALFYFYYVNNQL